MTLSEAVKYADFSIEKLISMDVEIERQEEIFVDDIVEEEALFDSGHRDRLAHSMLQSRGQLSPLTARVRLDERSVIVYDVIDGYHRDSGLKRIQEDFRTGGPLVQIALNFKSELKSKKGEAISQWKHIQIAHKVNEEILTAETVYKMVSDDSDGSECGLSLEEADELKSWYRDKQKIRTTCVVLYACSDEELYDRRVEAAVNSAKSVKFARMAILMHRSFSSASWQSERIGELMEDGVITLAQVFTIAHQFKQGLTRMPGKNLGVSSEEAAELIGWAIQKAERWDRPLSTLVQDMRTVEDASPKLVILVRQGGGGGRGKKGTFTLARLRAMTKHLPGNWDVQEQLARLSIDLNIHAEDLELLSEECAVSMERNDEERLSQIFSDPIKAVAENKKKISIKIKGKKVKLDPISLKRVQEVVDAAISFESSAEKREALRTRILGEGRRIDEMETPIVRFALENLGIGDEEGMAENYYTTILQGVIDLIVDNPNTIGIPLGDGSSGSPQFLPGENKLVVGRENISLTRGESTIYFLLLMIKRKVSHVFIRKALILSGNEDADHLREVLSLSQKLRRHKRRLGHEVVPSEDGVMLK